MNRLDKAFCLFVDPVQGDGCILPALCKISKAWKDQRDLDPSKVTAPLRMVMLEALLTDLQNRLKMLPEKQEGLDMAIKNQWLIRDGNNLLWQFQSHHGRGDSASKVPADGNDQGCGKDRRNHRPVPHGRPPSQVPCRQTNERGAQVTPDSVSSSGVTPGRCGQQFPLHPHGALRVCGVEDPQHPSSPGAPSALAARETAGILPQELVLRLQLKNSSNHCYMNSFILAFLWLATHPVGTQVELFGGLVSSVKPLLQGRARTFALIDLFMWRMFVQAWPRHSQEHDVVEFTMFLMRKATPPSYAGTWKAWGPEAKDQGHTHCPIIVDPVQPDCILQDAVACGSTTVW